MTSTPTRETPCRHCGAKLKVLKEIEIGGKKYAVSHEECMCPEARRERSEQEAKAKEYEEAKAQSAWQAKLSRANIPPKFQAATTERTDLVRTVLGGRGLYIQGDFGNGKSTTAAAIALEALRRNITAYFISDQQILSKLRATFGGNGTEDDVFNALTRPMILVIDDLGKMAPTEWSVSMIYRVIEERDLNLKPCIFTSNYTKQELVERFTVNGDSKTAEALVSRLFGTTDKVQFNGADRRLQ